MSQMVKRRQDTETILLAEDNEDHVFFIKRAFIRARFLNPLQVVHDGVEAIGYLKGEGKYADRTVFPFPALLLLDLKMPNKDGFQVMEWIREQSEMGALKIVVLTTSDRIFDVRRAYELGASSFLTKPLNLSEFIQLGPAIKGFWLWSSAEPEEVGMEAVTARKAGLQDGAVNA